MNKKIFTLLLLVFVLISMSAVSSADLNDANNVIISTSNENATNNVIGASNEDTILTASDGTLSDLATAVSGGGSVTLDKDYKYSGDEQDYIVISQNTEIDGAGHIINLTSTTGKKAALFTVNSECTLH